jgi:hypothetical protein
MGKWSRDQERPLELQGTEGVAGRLALWRRGFERIAQQPISISTVLCLHPLASTRIHSHPLASTSSGRTGRSREVPSKKKPRTTSLRGRCYAELEETLETRVYVECAKRSISRFFNFYCRRNNDMRCVYASHAPYLLNIHILPTPSHLRSNPRSLVQSTKGTWTVPNISRISARWPPKL